MKNQNTNNEKHEDWKWDYQNKFASKLSDGQFHSVGLFIENQINLALSEQRTEDIEKIERLFPSAVWDSEEIVGSRKVIFESDLKAVLTNLRGVKEVK